jgi:hypothetical protein
MARRFPRRQRPPAPRLDRRLSAIPPAGRRGRAPYAGVVLSERNRYQHEQVSQVPAVQRRWRRRGDDPRRRSARPHTGRPAVTLLHRRSGRGPHRRTRVTPNQLGDQARPGQHPRFTEELRSGVNPGHADREHQDPPGERPHRRPVGRWAKSTRQVTGAGSGGVLGLDEARELADLAPKEPQQRPPERPGAEATQPRACDRGRRRTAPRCPALGSGPVVGQGPNTVRGLDQPAGRIWSTAESWACWV